jgi:hypothetical protein
LENSAANPVAEAGAAAATAGVVGSKGFTALGLLLLASKSEKEVLSAGTDAVLEVCLMSGLIKFC